MTCDERAAEKVLMRAVIGTDAYDTLARLNVAYGFGDLARIYFDELTGSGMVIIRRFKMTDTTLNFRVQNGTIHYRGHRAKVKRSA